MDSSDLIFIGIAAFGASCQELLYWYELRSTLNEEKHSATLRSRRYWMIVLLMILVSGIGTWILYGESLEIRSIQFILGAAFPLLFKKLVAQAGSGGTKLGSTFSYHDYFNL